MLNEIKYLRDMTDFAINKQNYNRYRILVKETCGNTAYCFSTPIYNIKSGKIIHLSFERDLRGHIFQGSNSTVYVNKNMCTLENQTGRALLTLPMPLSVSNREILEQSEAYAVPTLNGLKITVNSRTIKLLLKLESKQRDIRFNSSCFSVMRDKFNPFLSVAALYATDGKGRFLPVEMKYQDKGNQVYTIELYHRLSFGMLTFEINLYEPKLFQDTTVESLHPDKNNAYGAIGFIGQTDSFGEQWLYSRPDFSRIPELTSVHVDKARLHIPVLNQNSEKINVFVPSKRFCSFGSTWNKKVAPSGRTLPVQCDGKYITIDVTDLFTNQSAHEFIYNEGLIIKKPKGKNNFIAVSTGDSYSAPQILEVKYK